MSLDLNFISRATTPPTIPVGHPTQHPPLTAERVDTASQSTMDVLQEALYQKRIFAPNHTVQALGAIYRGEEKAFQSLEELSNRGSLNPRETMSRMHGILSKNPHTDSPKVSRMMLERSAFGELSIEPGRKIPNPPAQDYERVTRMAGTLPKNAFSEGILTRKKPTSNEIDLNILTDSQIFEGAIDLTGSVQQVSFSNVQYGGAFPDLALQCDSNFAGLIGKHQRIGFLTEVLNNYGIVIDSKISNLNAPLLIKAISRSIKKMEKSPEEKQNLLEKVTRDVVVALVGRAELASEYLYQFNDRIPLGRDYFGHGQRGFSLATHFAHYEDGGQNGTISLNMYIKEGGADCRGTNTLYAMLLNIGYKDLGSHCEAKILYARVVIEPDVDAFTRESPADHNIVVVFNPSAVGPEQYRVMDARLHNNDNLPVRELIHGTVDNTGVALQLVGANRYPIEQSGLIQAEESARSK